MLGQNQIVEKIEFPLVVDDDYDPVTVSITQIPVMLRQPNPVNLDDGLEDCYILIIANWGEDPIEYEKFLCRLEDLKKLDWEKADRLRDYYETIVIGSDGYVARQNDKIICCIYDGEIGKYVVMFFEVIA